MPYDPIAREWTDVTMAGAVDPLIGLLENIVACFDECGGASSMGRLVEDARRRVTAYRSAAAQASSQIQPDLRDPLHHLRASRSP